MASYNFRKIQSTIIKDGARAIEARAGTALKKRFEGVKSDTINEFNKHPVTKEIESHGQLFGFLGFYEDEVPTQDVREYLEEHIQMRDNLKLTASGDKIIVTKTVEMPSLSGAYEDIESDGVSEWSTKSWLQLLEDGIPFFSHFLRKSSSEASRSKAGIQSKNPVRPGIDYPKVKYLSEILTNLKARIMKTKK
jgi:hypothetical protein